MKKPTQVLLVIIGVLDIATAVFVALRYMNGKEIVVTVIPAMIAFNFFMYKLLTGWLIANMTVKIEGTRQPVSGEKGKDHLGLKVTLTKGSIDSVWVDRIEIRLKRITDSRSKSLTTAPLIPLNIAKRGDIDDNYWRGKKSLFYTISSGEEAIFSAYIKVPSEAVISAELLVLGTRLFHGIESCRNKRIQWRSSAVLLPYFDK